MNQPLLSVRNLVKEFGARGLLGRTPPVRAVDDVSFDVMPGEALGLVGESGSGKSTIGRAVTMLSPPTAGTVTFEGVRIDTLKTAALRPIRRRMQIVFQDPSAALNPRMRVGDFIAEPLVIHGLYPIAQERAEYVAELLRKVGLDPAFGRRWPHEFSGGQRQRICIARAIALKPRFIVADEPITALDVSIQAQIVNLLQDLQAELGLAYLFISHDLRMVRHLCSRVIVLQQGRVVEEADSRTLFAAPAHPYTRRLLAALPIPDPKAERARRERVREGAL